MKNYVIKFGIIAQYKKDKSMYQHMGFFKFPKAFLRNRGLNYLWSRRYCGLMLPCIFRNDEGKLIGLPNDSLPFPQFPNFVPKPISSTTDNEKQES